MLIELDTYRRRKPAASAHGAAAAAHRQPAFSVIVLPGHPQSPESPRLPADDAAVDAAFMTRVCALASQI